MARTPSNMLALQTKAPDFRLPNVIDEKLYELKQLRGSEVTVLMFICNHCPFVVHLQKALVSCARAYDSDRVGFIAISSNDVENYPQDGPDKMKELAMHLHFPFPYLYDQSQEVAKAYDAACTPDFYVFDKRMKLVYRGQFDDSRPGNDISVTGEDLRNAIDAILENRKVSSIQKPSIGCNIKWK
ncbi:MAG: thioredoxin family protein [Flavobacteriaceae bacterium]|nr:thioredoxin family protein [Flavobacteriaceae bacterium]